MSKKNPTPISVPRDGVQRTLNVTDAYQLLDIQRTHFWKLRKKHDLRRTEKSTDKNPRYRQEDVIKMGVDEGLLYWVDAVPQGGTAPPVEPVSKPVLAVDAGYKVAPGFEHITVEEWHENERMVKRMKQSAHLTDLD